MLITNQEEIASQTLQTLAKPTTVTASKKEYETIFKFMFLGATIFSAILLHKVYLFQKLAEFDQAREGKLMDIIIYGLPFSFLYTIIDTIIHYFLDEPFEKYYLTPEKYTGEARPKRAYTLVKWSYSLVYYLITSITAYLLIKDTSFFPTWLGGSGSCLNIAMHSPALPEATFGMKIFYLVQFGKHFSRLYVHMFIRREGNFYEYVLHHALSTFLIFFSYLTNQWLVGIMVLLCHDLSDFFLILSRGYKVKMAETEDYKNYSEKILKMFYSCVAVTWIGCRLIVFPTCCVYSSLMASKLIEGKVSELAQNILGISYTWMGIMLVGLQILQVFWTFYIAKAFISVNVSSKLAQNTYE